MTTEHTPELWTEEAATAFTEALAGFRDSLPPRQREAFEAIRQTAAAAAADQDVEGYGGYADAIGGYLGMARLVGVITPYYPPGVRTDAAR